MFKKLFPILLIALVVFSFIVGQQVFADLAVSTASFGTQDVYEVNNMTPGSSKTFLGTRLQGPLVAGVTAETVGATLAADNITAGETITTPLVTVVTGASWGSSTTMNDGYQNQQVTFVLKTDGGKDHKISCDTKTGFTDITLGDAQDSITLKYIDSTIGWVVVGNAGATIN